ncbi:flagellar hook-length control protein FliK [Rossellomorea vietnamensis]|uniref:Flagellar hook-length control protein FliK n=1 Tax=Rossellomorea vietnamensis TaxID=218284 RepID=A0A5D4MGF6_9BACI|nr:flagellar hook-length control protein FliK [Rossellomorea vietnamensis]TYS00136.1 flagellar hook-length control protein FliK [Rossellomorea vietnamensis]
MNVGAMLSMQNLGQLSNREKVNGSQEGENGILFSRLFSSEMESEASGEQIETEMMQLLKLLQILQGESTGTLETKEISDVNLKAVLTEAGFTEMEFLEAVQSLMQGIVKEIPQLKEIVSLLKEEEGEEALIQLLEVISLVSVDNLKKLDQPSLQLLLKASKVLEQGLRQTDSNNIQAEKAESLQNNLRIIGQKLEQIFNGGDLKSAKWSEILKRAFDANLSGRNTDAISKNAVQHSFSVNKPSGEKSANLVQLNGKHLSFQTNNIDSAAESPLEGEKPSKGNGVPFTSLIGQHQTGKIEQFSLFLNRNQNGTTYEQFVKEFANILGRSQMMHTPNMSKLLIKLYPEQLGSLRIEILQQNGVMTARILASTKAAKDILDSQLTGLRQALSSQNLQVEKIEVAHTLNEMNRQERQPSQQNNGQQPKEQSNQQQDENENPETTFKELLMNSEV